MARQPRQLAGIGAADLPTQAAVEAYRGPPRELIVGADGLRYHDGTTPGGNLLLAAASFQTLAIPRAAIPTKAIPLDSFTVAGFALVGDEGAGARYIRATSGAFMAIQDVTGKWFAPDFSGRMIFAGWLGLRAFDASNAAADFNRSNVNAALAHLGGLGSGSLICPCKTYYVSGAIERIHPGVWLSGGRYVDSNQNYTDGQATIFRATKDCVDANGNPVGVVRIRTPFCSESGKSLVNNPCHLGGGVVDIVADANAVARRAFEMISVCRAKVRVSAMSAIGDYAARLDCGVAGVDVGVTPSIQFCDIDLSVDLYNGASKNTHGVYIGGDPVTANVSLNQHINIVVKHQNGHGVIGETADNNVIHITSYPAGTGTLGKILIAKGAYAENKVGFEGNTVHLRGTTGYVLEDTDTPGVVRASRGRLILDTGNATPVIPPGPSNSWAYESTDGYQFFYPKDIMPSAGDSVTSALAAASLRKTYSNVTAVFANGGGAATVIEADSNSGSLVYRYFGIVNGKRCYRTLGFGGLEMIYHDVPHGLIGGITVGNSFLPNSDNQLALGSGAYRFSTANLGSSPIVGSDARLKTKPASLPAGLIAAMGEIKVLSFKYLSSIEVKGEEHARQHVGVIAQDVVEACERHGQDPFKWGFLCKDKDENGDEYLAVRYDQIMLGMIAALRAN